MEDDQNGREPQLKTTSMEDELNGRQSQWKTTSRKPYRKQMTSACLASQFRTELGPAQPQLVEVCLLDLYTYLEWVIPGNEYLDRQRGSDFQKERKKFAKGYITSYSYLER